jgi:hypothetical protein
VQTKDESSGSVTESLVEQEDSLGNVSSEADEYLELLLRSESTVADCDIYGLKDDLLESEWETLMEIFKAIANLGYVVTGEDHILLDDEDEALTDRRNLRRIRRRLLSSNSRTCRTCDSAGITSDTAFEFEEGYVYVSPFNQFVNAYVAAFIMAKFAAHLENGVPLKVECTFS